MEPGIYINVSATDYEKASTMINTILTRVQEMTHGTEKFAITDSEFAFGWHFFVVVISVSLVQRFIQQMGNDYARLKGKGEGEKFVSWMRKQIGDTRGIKIELKEKMESSRFGIF